MHESICTGKFQYFHNTTGPCFVLLNRDKQPGTPRRIEEKVPISDGYCIHPVFRGHFSFSGTNAIVY
jgi:hypothetical protein